MVKPWDMAHRAINAALVAYTRPRPSSSTDDTLRTARNSARRAAYS